MAGIPPLKGSAYTFYVSLVAQADTDLFKTTATISAGDVQLSKDGGAFANVTTLPSEIGTSGVLSVPLSATEMNADVITVRFRDAAGSEWQDLLATIETETLQINDLATPTNITAGTIATVTTLTNLPPITTDWLTGGGVKADAVTKIQAGLALEATLTAIKGAGWSTETLAAIDVLIDAIKAKTDNLPASPAATGDIPTANITAIKAKTDLLPASPAATGDIPTADITAIKAKTDLIPASPAATSDIPTANITAIKAKTDLLPASPAATGDIPTADITAIKAKTDLIPASIPTAAQTADAVWDELLSGHAVPGSTAAALAASGGASDPLLNAVPGVYTSGTAGAALGRIGSGAITTVSPVSQSGDVETYQGDDYETALGRAIDWTDASADWPDLSGATIAVVIGSALELAGSVVTPTGGSKQVRVELTHTESAAIRVGNHPFQVIATLTGGDVITLLDGQWTSRRRLTA